MPKKLVGSAQAGKGAGRPRSTDATLAVRTAALELAYEGGVHFATIERIAERCGVAKTTIYRRWPNAASIVMDAFLEEISPKITYRMEDRVEDTFAAAVRHLVTALKGRRGDLLRHLLGAAQADPQLQAAFWDNWIGPRRQQAMAVIADAQERGQLPKTLDADALVDTIFGAVYYRLMIPYKDLSAAYAESMVRQVFDGAAGGRSIA